MILHFKQTHNICSNNTGAKTDHGCCEPVPFVVQLYFFLTHSWMTVFIWYRILIRWLFSVLFWRNTQLSSVFCCCCQSNVPFCGYFVSSLWMLLRLSLFLVFCALTVISKDKDFLFVYHAWRFVLLTESEDCLSIHSQILSAITFFNFFPSTLYFLPL